MPRRLAYLCSLDLRSLAAFRIALGMVLLCDLALRWSWIDMLYTSQGVLPAEVWFRSVDNWFYVSPLRWIDDPLGVRLFFLVSMASLTAMIVGFKTRWSTLASLVCWASISHRNPLVLIGADQVASAFLLWGTLLPLGEYWSVDAWRRAKTSPVEANALPRPVRTAPSLAALAVLLQIASIYFLTAINKTGETWYDGTAIYYAFRMEQCLFAPGVWAQSLPLWVIRTLTYTTLVAEFAAAPLIFSPWGQPWCRRILLVLLTGLHVGIALTLNAGAFSYIMLSGLLLLLGGADWQWIQRPCGVAASPHQERIGEAAKSYTHLAWQPCLDIVAGVMMILVACNAYVFNGPGGSIRTGSTFAWRLGSVAQLAGARQRWDMFSPDVRRFDYWWVAEAELADESGKVDLFTGIAPEYAQPSRLDFRPTRWGGFLGNLLEVNPLGSRVEALPLNAALCRYLANRYTAATGKPLKSLTLNLMSKRIPDPGAEDPGETYARRLGVYQVATDSYLPQLPRVVTIRNSQGWIEAQGPVEYDLENGVWTFWYESGQIRSQGPYQAGRKHGEWTEWYERKDQAQSDKLATGPYIRGKQTGLWTYWYSGGQRRANVWLVDGVEEGPCKLWYEIGTPRAEGLLKQGLRDDIWKFYTAGGSLEAEGKFQRGHAVGKWTYFQPIQYTYYFSDTPPKDPPAALDIGTVPRS